LRSRNKDRARLKRLSDAVTQRVDDQRKGSRCLAATRVVKMISAPGRRPFAEHPDELALRDVRPCQILRYVSQAKAGERRIANLKDVVEDELSIHSDLELTATSLELPGPQSPMSRLAQVDARVGNEVLWDFWNGVTREVGLRSDHGKANIGPMRTETMSLATCSPKRTPASKR